jgi:MinD-like ATPase involved in chromosome partitioning or flagellar assembly
MAMDRVFVTVEGPSRKVDIALPNSRTISELIPTLVEMVESGSAPPDGATEWVLLSSGRELDPAATLVRESVADGSTLTLNLRKRRTPIAGAAAPGAPASPPNLRPVAPPVPAFQSLIETRQIAGLPAPLGFGERLRTVADAVRSNDVEPVPELAVGRRTSAVDRARRAWESSDYRRQLEEVIATPRLRRCVTIAVISPKGGVGKTTSTVLLGTLLAMVRNDRVIAVDYDPDYGTLGRMIETSDAVHVDELVQVLEQPALTVSMLDRCLGRAAHGLMVLPAPEDPERMDRLEVEAYERVIKRLQNMAGILVLDCGAGVRNPFARAAIAAADQLVLVTDGSPTTASVVATAASKLPSERDYVLAVNRAMETHTRLDVEQLRAALPNARGIVEIGHEPAAASNLEEGRFTWEQAPPSWQLAGRQLAATLVTGWEELGLAG